MIRQPTRTNLSDFIKTKMGSQFVIPVYQRNYTWNPANETAQFMKDIQRVLTKEENDHFLGIIIYMESELSMMFRQLQIVDGQQRLTTAFIFLLALKNLAEEKKDKNVAGMIEDYYLYNRHSSEDASLRLRPAVSGDDVYAKLVYAGVKSLSVNEKQSGVYQNYIYIERTLRSWSHDYSLLEILNCLNRMDILEFPLSETDNVQQIFESINSTGAPLTSADLIRNYILMNHTNEVQERYYRMYWEPLEKMFPDSGNLESFFRTFISARTYVLLNRRDVYEGFKSCWQNSTLTDEEKLQEVNAFCRSYYEIYKGPAEDKEIEEVLARFRKLDSLMPAPFVSEMYVLTKRNELSSEDFIRIMNLLENYLMRRAVMEKDSAPLSRYFPSLLQKVLLDMNKSGKDVYKIVRKYLVEENRSDSLAMPTDDQITAQLKEANAYSFSCIRALLERMEQFEASAKVDTSSLNIEHIMPIHPNTWWKNNSGTENEEEYASVCNLIGNLTLCAAYDNTRMGNSDFTAKKNILSKTMHIRLNNEILRKRTWNKKEIQKRTKAMIDLFLTIYPYKDIVEKVQKKVTKETPKGRAVYTLDLGTMSAKAYGHSPKDIEVLAGSRMKPYTSDENKERKALYKKLLKDGSLVKENNRVKFARGVHFHSWREAASFVSHKAGKTEGLWVKTTAKKKTAQKKERQ